MKKNLLNNMNKELQHTHTVGSSSYTYWTAAKRFTDFNLTVVSIIGSSLLMTLPTTRMELAWPGS